MALIKRFQNFYSRLYWKRRIFWIVVSALRRVTKPYRASIILSDSFPSISRQDHESQRQGKRKWGLVIQGPLSTSTQINRVLRYAEELKKNNSVLLVISTYLDEFNSNKFESIRQCRNVLIVKSDYSEVGSNFQGQILTSFRGLKAASEQGCTHLIKLRSDQSIDLEVTLDLFDSILDTFPTLKEETRERLIFSSMNTWLYRPLGLSDMLIAGPSTSMLQYWSWDDEVKSLTNPKYALNIRCSDSWITGRSLFCETFLAAKYLLYKDFLFSTDSMADYQKALQDYYVVINAQDINHAWDKRRPEVIGNTSTKFANGLPPYLAREIQFSDWILISQKGYRPYIMNPVLEV